MKPVVAILSSPFGRAVRWLIGVTLMAWGLLGSGEWAGFFVTLAGIILVLCAIYDVTPLAAIFGYPVEGWRLRRAFYPTVGFLRRSQGAQRRLGQRRA